MDSTRKATIVVSPIILVEYQITKMHIETGQKDTNEPQHAKLSVEFKLAGKTETDDGKFLHRLILSVSLYSSDDDSGNIVDATIAGSYIADDSVEAKNAILNDGAMELYTILKANAYSTTSGEVMLPSLIIKRDI